MTKHYDIPDWLDLLRGFPSPEARLAMESHRENCAQCRDTLAWVTRLQSTAEADSRSDVPAQVVRNAQAIFALRRLEQIQSPMGSLARMIYDSFQQPALQGVRSEQRSDIRHMIFEADDYVIDLRLEHERDLASVSMIGQIHLAANTDARVTPMAVTLTSNQNILAATTCNDFGEFAMSYEPKGSLCLHLGLEGKFPLEA